MPAARPPASRPPARGETRLPAIHILLHGAGAGLIASIPTVARGIQLGAPAPTMVTAIFAAMLLCSAGCWLLHRRGFTWARPFLIAAGMASPFLWIVAHWLLTGTHHRPLGAVTFTLFAFVMLSGSFLLTLRTLALPLIARITTLLSLFLLVGIFSATAVSLTKVGALGGLVDVLLALGAVIILTAKNQAHDKKFALKRRAGATAHHPRKTTEEGSAAAESAPRPETSVADTPRQRKWLFFVWCALAVAVIFAIRLNPSAVTAISPALTWPFRFVAGL